MIYAREHQVVTIQIERPLSIQNDRCPGLRIDVKRFWTSTAINSRPKNLHRASLACGVTSLPIEDVVRTRYRLTMT